MSCLDFSAFRGFLVQQTLLECHLICERFDIFQYEIIENIKNQTFSNVEIVSMLFYEVRSSFGAIHVQEMENKQYRCNYTICSYIVVDK